MTSLEALMARMGWNFRAHFADNGRAMKFLFDHPASAMASYLARVRGCQNFMAFERLHDERGFDRR